MEFVRFMEFARVVVVARVETTNIKTGKTTHPNVVPFDKLRHHELTKDTIMAKGYMYILKCADDSYYTGSTVNIELRLEQHQSGEGANHTRKRLPVVLVYYEEYQNIADAFYREKQVQGWSRKKKEALIENIPEDLPLLSKNNQSDT